MGRLKVTSDSDSQNPPKSGFQKGRPKVLLSHQKGVPINYNNKKKHVDGACVKRFSVSCGQVFFGIGTGI